jgi:YVTN family beta-propeller protein
VLPSAAAVATSSSHPDLTTTTTSTIDLYKNSVVPGNVEPRYLNGPDGIAYNPVNHLDMVAGAESCSLALVDPTVGVVQTFPQPLVNSSDFGPPCALGGVLFDSRNDQTFVADTSGSSVLVYNTSAGGVVTFDKSIPLWPGSQPGALAVDPTNNRVFVADANNSTVSVLNGTTDVWIADVGVGSEPSSLVYDPTQDAVYVANTASDNITWIDATTLSTGLGLVGSTYAVPGGPVALALAPTQDIIWILLPDYLTAFNSTSRATSVNYTLASAAPSSLYWDSTQNQLYAINAPSGSISVFNMSGVKLTAGVPPNSNAKKPALTIATGGIPTLAASDTHLGEVDLLDSAANTIIRVPDSTQTVLNRTALGASPGGLAFNPITDGIMVTDSASNRVYEVNSRNTTAGTVPVIGSFPVSGHPVDVAYDPDTGWLVVASNPGTVTAIDPTNGAINVTDHLGSGYNLWNILYAQHQIFVTASSGWFFTFNATTLVRTQEGQIGSGGPSAPRMMAYDAATGNLYVALAGDNKIAVVNGASSHQTASFSAPGAPYGVAYDPVGNHLFVVGSQTSVLTVMSPATGAVVRTVPLGFLPGWIEYNPYSQSMYIANERSGTVTVVDPSFTMPPFEVSVGSYPGGMAYSPVTGDMFVSDAASSTLSVLPVASPVRAPFTANISVTPPETDVGVEVVVSEHADLPAWALSYQYPTLPPGCTSKDVPTLDCLPSTVGVNEAIAVTISNLAGDEFNLTASVTVNPLPQIASFIATPTAVTLGKTVMLAASVVGGVPPYKYAYSQVPFGCTAPALPVWNCTPLNQGSPFYVSLTVTDAVHYAVSALANFTVNFVPQVAVTLSVSSIGIDQKVLISVNVTHGTPPFSYAYSGLPAGCLSANSAVLACYPTASGVFDVKVTVTDASLFSEQGSVTLTVVAASSSSSSSGTYVYIGIAIVVVVAAIAVGLFLMRRSRPSGPGPARPAEPVVELYGAGAASLPRSTVESVAVPGQAKPIPPRPEVSSETPRYFTPAEDEAPMAAPAPTAPSSGPRPPVKCPHCGQMNQPWLINCRACGWPLAQT